VRIAFLGTPDVAVPALAALLAADDVEVAVVLTNPDRPKGRSRHPVAPPVKQAAQAAGVEVWQPTKPAEVRDDLAALELDACAVVAYGALLPARVLEVGGRGFVNLHFSLLPRWRGAAPVQHALRAGDTVTGVTTFVLDEGMDTGPILRQAEVDVDPEESAGALLARLAELGAPLLVDSLRDLVGGATPTPQPTEGATLAPKIRPEDVALDLGASAREVSDLVRSADPAPGAHTTLRGERLKVFRAVPVERPADVAAGTAADAGGTAASAPAGSDGPAAAAGAASDAEVVPGTVLAADRHGVVVACGEGAVRLDVVQPAGKARMDGVAFANGARLEVGERLGEPAAQG
jgi:methionyl-tRNA formyltransferase